jgi:diacylglycerol kinase family enzyme
VRRATLIVNPFSTGVTPFLVDRVTKALAPHADLDVRQTERPRHAVELAAEAAGESEVILVLSGDGTYNEAVNGAAGRVPFGFLPGGGASVLPRALGLPRDPLRAAAQVAAALRDGRMRTIALGRVNGRRFCFAAGLGFDAEAVRRVDERGRDGDGRRVGNARFAAIAVGVLAERRFRVEPGLELAGLGRAAFLFVANGQPYTYAGRFPLRISREVEFEAGLDFAAPRRVTPLRAPGLFVRGLRGTLARDESVLAGHDVDELHVRCDRPLPLQADGEDLGDVTEAHFESERDALTVLV